jgi:DNA-binding response OmpR family regulator
MSRTGARILVVDAYPEAEALASALQGDGHRVRRAADAVGAMETLHRERADLAIIELTLPGWIDGIELAAYLAAREVPVVLTSRAANAEERLKILPYPSLRKPHEPAEICGQVRGALRAVYGVA